YRRRPTPRLAAQHAPVVPTQCNRPKRSLREVVVDRQVTGLSVTHQRRGVVRHVTDRRPQRRLRQRRRTGLFQPLLQLGEYGLGSLFPQSAALLLTSPTLVTHQRVVRGDQ